MVADGGRSDWTMAAGRAIQGITFRPRLVVGENLHYAQQVGTGVGSEIGQFTGPPSDIHTLKFKQR